MKVFDSHIAQTEKILENMRIRHGQGTALHNDVTRYELQLQNLNYTKTQLQNDRQILNNHLTVALGLSQDIYIQIDSVGIRRLPDKSPGVWEHEVQISSIPVRIAENAVRMNEYKKRICNSERLPKVALFAFNTFTGPVTIEIPALDKNFNYWGVGIGISYNFGSLYTSNKKVKAAELSICRAKEELRIAREQTALAVQAAHIKYIEAYVLLEPKQKSVELAVQNYDVVSYRYGNDLALITDLLDASSQKLDAELQAVNARINILYNYYKLQYISGTL